MWVDIDTSGPYKTLDIKSRYLKIRREEVIPFYIDILTKANSKGQLPRDDYRECAMLMLQLLGVTPPGGNKWYKPTASSNARWMVAVLFGSKIVAFSDQLQFEDGELEKFERFVTFCALFYVPHWLTTPLGVDAPSNDLKFWKDMQQFRAEDQAVADVALCALDRHLWYATEECAALSVFSSKVSDTEKAQIAKEILRRKSKYNENDLGQPTFPTLATGTKLKDLIGPKSWFLFSLFDKVDWLAKPVKSWSSDPSFQVIFEVVTHMKVVNDLAEILHH